jgi:hypothetical protein
LGWTRDANGCSQSSQADEKNFVFQYKGGKLGIPYDQVNDLEYGQKAGRRLGLALTISPWLLFSKKRNHFLTVGWKDAQDKQHAAVFELGKSIVRTTLATLEAFPWAGDLSEIAWGSEEAIHGQHNQSTHARQRSPAGGPTSGRMSVESRPRLA